MTPPLGTSVALRRGWGRGGGVFLVTSTLLTSTLLLASGCATKGDVQGLQDEVARQAALQDAQLRDHRECRRPSRLLNTAVGHPIVSQSTSNPADEQACQHAGDVCDDIGPLAAETGEGE